MFYDCGALAREARSNANRAAPSRMLGTATSSSARRAGMPGRIETVSRLVFRFQLEAELGPRAAEKARVRNKNTSARVRRRHIYP